MAEEKKVTKVKVFRGINNKYYIQTETEFDGSVEGGVNVDKIGKMLLDATGAGYYDSFIDPTGKLLYAVAGKSLESEVTKPI